MGDGRVEASSEYRALLDAVLDRPDDDMPRLAMADWYEEQGQGEQAEMIRHGIAHPGWRMGVETIDLPIFYEIRRGFPETAICTLADFLRHAEWIANNWPVKEVRITGGSIARRPSNIDYPNLRPNFIREWKYSVGDAPDIPSHVVKRITKIYCAVLKKKASRAFTTFPNERRILCEVCMLYLRELRTRTAVTA